MWGGPVRKHIQIKLERRENLKSTYEKLQMCLLIVHIYQKGITLFPNPLSYHGDL